MFSPKSSKETNNPPGLHTQNSAGKLPNNIQAKLEINQPGDEYEKEADEMAQRVVQRKEGADGSPHPPEEGGRNIPHGYVASGPNLIRNNGKIMRSTGVKRFTPGGIVRSTGVKRFNSPIMRKGTSGENRDTSSGFQNKLDSTKGSGSPLPESVKGEMESGFGADFSGVKLHSDSNAVQLSNEINAQAFTHGDDIYFNSGKLDVGSDEGKGLLAHELTHTLQQRGGIQRQENTKDPKNPHGSSGHDLSSLQMLHMTQTKAHADENGATIDQDTGSCLLIAKLIYLKIRGFINQYVEKQKVMDNWDYGIIDLMFLKNADPNWSLHADIAIKNGLVPVNREIALSSLYGKKFERDRSGRLFVYGSLRDFTGIDRATKKEKYYGAGELEPAYYAFGLDTESDINKTRLLYKLDSRGASERLPFDMKIQPIGTATYYFDTLLNDDLVAKGYNYRSMSKIETGGNDKLLNVLSTMQKGGLINESKMKAAGFMDTNGKISGVAFSKANNSNLSECKPYLVKHSEHSWVIYVMKKTALGGEVRYDIVELDPYYPEIKEKMGVDIDNYLSHAIRYSTAERLSIFEI